MLHSSLEILQYIIVLLLNFAVWVCLQLEENLCAANHLVYVMQPALKYSKSSVISAWTKAS